MSPAPAHPFLPCAAAIKLHPSRIELRDRADPPKGVAEAKAAAEKAEPVRKFTGELQTFAQLGLSTFPTVHVKDLGPQVPYRTVFYVEYAGPILIIALAMLRPFGLFGKDAGPISLLQGLTRANMDAAEGSAKWRQFVQALAIALWLAHFVKRELETAFVHKFSNPSMPLFNIFKNCTYYWGFAAFVAYPLVHTAYQAPGKVQVAVGGALWAASQLTNLAVHLQLASMRSGGDGDNARRPPGGFLFSLVTSPNYTAEVLGWVGWSVLSSIAMGYIFTAAGLLQMAQWALKKRAGYFKDGEGGKEYAKGRKAIIPWVL